MSQSNHSHRQAAGAAPARAKDSKSIFRHSNPTPLLVIAVVLALTGIALLGRSGAAGNTMAVEAETGTPGGNAAAKTGVAGASGNSAVAFGGSPSPTPTPNPTPNPGSVPVGKTELFLGNFDTGDLSQWPNTEGDKGMTVLEDGPGHETAMKVTLNDGDTAAGGNRAEVNSWMTSIGSHPTHVKEGDERWYETDIKFPADFKNPSGGWYIVMQWHSSSGSPPLALNVNNDGTIKLGGDGVSKSYHKTIGPIKRGQWVHYVLHVKFSNNASSGWAEVWEDGVLKVPKHNRPSMSSSHNYLKQGIYRGGGGGTTIVWHDGLRITAP